MDRISSRSTDIVVFDHQEDLEPRTCLAPTKAAREERIWTWLLRLVLPLTLGLCVQLIIWMWVTTPYPIDVWSICGGVLLAIVSLLIAVWTWHSWLPFDREIIARSMVGSFLRYAALILITGAVVLAFTNMDTGHDASESSAGSISHA
jgi:hypothetical protein